MEENVRSLGFHKVKMHNSGVKNNVKFLKISQPTAQGHVFFLGATSFLHKNFKNIQISNLRIKRKPVLGNILLCLYCILHSPIINSSSSVISSSTSSWLRHLRF